MGLLQRLFGNRDARVEAASAADATEDYKGFTICATPQKEQGQYLVAGTIEKSLGGEVKTYRFIRADRSPDRDEISSMSLAKARLIVDQQGDQMFL